MNILDAFMVGWIIELVAAALLLVAAGFGLGVYVRGLFD